MAISPRLDLRQSQSLVMTPHLMQAIQLLQMSNLDLVAYIQRELESNPLLEAENDDYANAESQPGSEQDSVPDEMNGAASALTEEAIAPNDVPDLGEQLADNAKNAEAITDDLDAGLDNVFPDDNKDPEPVLPQLNDPWMSTPTRNGGANPDFDLETVLAGEVSLSDYLERQMMAAIIDERQRMIGHYLINELDENGYLHTDFNEIAERLSIDRSEVENVLESLQGFEPVGVFARSLSECLALQLKDLNRYDPAIAALLDNLDLLAKRDFAALRRVCGVDMDDMLDMITEIRNLNPRPGSAIGSIVVQPVIPDVFVKETSNGGWHIELNSETLPRLLVNRNYYAKISQTARGKTEKAFLVDCLQSANWLVKSLDQRAQTILKVATEIVRQQDAFFAYGVTHLRPLNLKTIADAISMHESTVSRVTSNKYMATNRGVFEMKYFFTSAISGTQGSDQHSAEAVKHRIKQAIDEESADKVLSDDALVKLLRQSGIDIARRTVAKYREAMQIPSSVQRRREKRAALT